MNHYIRTTLTRMAIAAVSFAAMPFVLCADSSPVTKTRLGSLYPDDLVVTDVSAGVDTNTVRDIIKEDLITATNGFIRTESDPTVGLTNNTVYASGTNVTFLTDHQDLSFTNDYRKVSDAIDWEDVTNHADFVDSTYVSEAIVSAIVDDLASTNVNKALSANKGRELEEQIQSLQARGRYLSVWDSSAGLPNTNPPVSPYAYKSGDYYIVGGVGTTNYRPSGSVYTNGVRSTEVETNAVSVNDTYYFDNEDWTLVHLDQPSVAFSTLTGEPEDNAALSNRFYTIAEELHSITGDVYVVTTNLQITSSNLSDRIYGLLDVIRGNKRDIDAVNYTVGLIISSNELMSIAISGLSTNVSNVEEAVRRVAESIPERTPDNVYTNLSQYIPVFMSGARSDRVLYIRAVDGAYHDARTISGYPGSEVYANTFQESFPISSLYGHEFSYAYLTNVLPQVTWTSGFTLSAGNLHATAESVCGARNFWTFYGRPALVRDLVYVLMWLDHYLWYDTTGMTGYSRMFVDFHGLRAGLDSAVDYAAAAHKSLAELSYRLASGTGCASVPISSDTVEASSLVTTVTVTPDIVKSVHVQDSADTVILKISAPSAIDDRSRKCATETRLTVDSPVTVRVSSADAWGSVRGQDLFRLGAGEYIVGTQRIAYNADDGTCLYTAYAVDIYDQFYGDKASLSVVTGIVESAAVTNAGAVAAAKAYTDMHTAATNDLCWVDSAVKTRDGSKTVSAGDIGALAVDNPLATGSLTVTSDGSGYGGNITADGLLSARGSVVSGTGFTHSWGYGTGVTYSNWGVDRLSPGGPRRSIGIPWEGRSVRDTFSSTDNSFALASDIYDRDIKHVRIGDNSVSNGDDYSVAVGDGTLALGRHSFALGAGGVVASGTASVAIGNSVSALGGWSTALGYNSHAYVDTATALGGNSHANGERALAAGWAATVDSLNATSLGNGAHVLTNAVGAVAIGSGAVVGNNATNAVQLGFGRNNDPETLQFMDKKVMLQGMKYPLTATTNSLGYTMPDLNAVKVSVPNGIMWKPAGSVQANVIVYGDGRFIAGDAARLYHSADGLTWSSVKALPAACSAAAYGRGRFVVGTDGAGLLYSYDGIDWSQSSTTNGAWTGVAYGGGRFIAVSRLGSIQCSDDGSNWEPVTATGYDYRAIAYGGRRFVAASHGSGLQYSDDGSSWNTISELPAYWDSVTYGNWRFVAGSRGDGIWYSDDGKNWHQSSVTNGSWSAVAYGNGRFVSVGQNTGIWYSDDGDTWARAVSTTGWLACAYGGERFIAGGTRGLTYSADISIQAIRVVQHLSADGVPISVDSSNTADIGGAITTIANDIVNAKNPAFSNEVLAVGLTIIDTNTVAQVQELIDDYGDIPPGAAGTTIGALLMALAAAVASLKKAVGSANKDLEDALNGENE